MHIRLAQSLRVLAAALSIGCFAPAQAAVYTGQWDPAYGPALPGLGFQGSAQVFVPDACLTGSPAATPTAILDSDACAAGGMNLLSAKVEFYDLLDPNTILETLIFAPPALLPDPVFAAYILFNSGTNSNEVVGVSTVLFGPEQSNLALAGSLQFSLTFVWNPLTGHSEAKLFDSNGGSSNVAEIDFTRDPVAVPEPGSLALVAAALGAGWAVRRRRQRG